MDTIDINWVRSHFPALISDYVFMDNAGGSQACRQVIERITTYFHQYNVQLGASYKVSDKAGIEFQKIHHNLVDYFNADEAEEIIVGPSTTALLRILSICLSENWKEGDEVIVTNSDHEANVSCWMDLRKKGIEVKIWKINEDSLQFEIDDLSTLLTEKTKLVAMVHASNILGTINPISEISKVVHNNGAYFCVDGVAYAPHRKIDVKAFDVDFYVFSTYKTYGPHQAILYGKRSILEDLPGFNHFFIHSSPYKFQPGNFNFELTYGIQGILDYWREITAHHSSLSETNGYDLAFKVMADHEEKLSARLLDYLNHHPNIKIIGKKSSDKTERVPTISFIHEKMKSNEIVGKVDPHDIGIRFGDFYAKRLIQDLGLEQINGVVRVSMVHYNTIEEVNKLIKVFEEIL